MRILKNAELNRIMPTLSIAPAKPNAYTKMSFFHTSHALLMFLDRNLCFYLSFGVSLPAEGSRKVLVNFQICCYLQQI